MARSSFPPRTWTLRSRAGKVAIRDGAQRSMSEQERVDAYVQGLVEAGTPTRRTLGIVFFRALKP